jgi:hypothetical protein
VALDPQRCGYRADPLVLLVPHLDDDSAGVALRQPVGSDLSRRAGRRLHGGVEIVELCAVIVAHKRLSILDIEEVTGHGTLL